MTSVLFLMKYGQILFVYGKKRKRLLCNLFGHSKVVAAHIVTGWQSKQRKGLLSSANKVVSQLRISKTLCVHTTYMVKKFSLCTVPNLKLHRLMHMQMKKKYHKAANLTPDKI